MLRGLVLPGSSAGVSAEHIEAVTAERDFFREKYTGQIDELEQLKDRLKESQRVIDKLRSEILDSEVDKSSRSTGQRRSPTKAPKQMSGGSTTTSVTCQTDDDDRTTKSNAENNAESANDVPSVAVVGDGAASSDIVTETEGKENDPTADSPEVDERSISTSSEEGEEESAGEDDEVDNIRRSAERMLLWADYQTSKRPTPNTTMVEESLDGLVDENKTGSRSHTPSKMGVSDAIVYSLPTSLDRTMLDDDSSLGSGSRHNSSTRTSNGKLGNIFNNLRDMIDPPLESDSGSESDEESTD